MSTTHRFDVFISHSSADKAWTRRLKSALVKSGLTVWLDCDEIRPGEILVTAMEKGLEACGAVVIVVSPDSMSSGWVAEEYSRSLALAVAGDLNLIPCLLRDAELPRFLANRKWVDFRDESRFMESLSDLIFGLRGRHEEQPPSNAKLLPHPLRIPPPHPMPALIGREKTLALVRQAIVTRDCRGLFALFGMPGIGKTAIALAVAYDREIQQLFDHNVIWVELGRKPDVLNRLAAIGASLGISSAEIATRTSIQSRCHRIREELGSQPVLVIIDDVWNLDDALAFRLGGETSTHLVTTRHLNVALEFAGSQRGVEAVKELGKKESLEILRRYVPELVHDLAEKCGTLAEAVGRLPLALIIMGSYLRQESFSGQRNRLRRALERLGSSDDLLRMHASPAAAEHGADLPMGSLPTSLWETIGMSYEVLDVNAQRMLRALSVFPPKPNTFSEAAACAVSLVDVETLNALVDCGLLEWAMVDAADSTQDRYALHQAIESYAKEQHESDSEPADFCRRMVSYFVNLINYHKDMCGGYKGLEAESANVCAALQGAHERGAAQVFLAGVRELFDYMESVGLYHPAEDILKRAEAIALDLGDTAALAETLNGRARIARKQGKYVEAEAWARAGLHISSETGNGDVSCLLLGNLGGVIANLGRYREAAGYLDRALSDACKLGRDDHISTLLRQSGAIACNLGDFSRAEEYFRRGLTVAGTGGRGRQYGRLCAFIGELKTFRGEYQQAEDYLKKGLAKAEEIAYVEVECISLQNLGFLETKRGNDRAADRFLRRSLQLARELGHQERISYVLADLAFLKMESRAFKDVPRLVEEARAIANEIGHPKRIAFLMMLAGRLAHENGKHGDAESALSSALELGRATEHWWNVSSALSALGDLYIEQHQLDAASEVFESLWLRSKEAAIPEFAAAACFGRARILDLRCDSAAALKAASESLEIYAGLGHRAAGQVESWRRDRSAGGVPPPGPGAD